MFEHTIKNEKKYIIYGRGSYMNQWYGGSKYALKEIIFFNRLVLDRGK